jgi:hypothetical protein
MYYENLGMFFLNKTKYTSSQITSRKPSVYEKVCRSQNRHRFMEMLLLRGVLPRQLHKQYPLKHQLRQRHQKVRRKSQSLKNPNRRAEINFVHS